MYPTLTLHPDLLNILTNIAKRGEKPMSATSFYEAVSVALYLDDSDYDPRKLFGAGQPFVRTLRQYADDFYARGIVIHVEETAGGGMMTITVSERSDSEEHTDEGDGQVVAAEAALAGDPVYSQNLGDHLDTVLLPVQIWQVTMFTELDGSLFGKVLVPDWKKSFHVPPNEYGKIMSQWRRDLHINHIPGKITNPITGLGYWEVPPMAWQVFGGDWRAAFGRAHDIFSEYGYALDWQTHLYISDQPYHGIPVGYQRS